MAFPNQYLMLFLCLSFLGFFCFHSDAQQVVQDVCVVKNVDPGFCAKTFAPYAIAEKDNLNKLYSITLSLSSSTADANLRRIGDLLNRVKDDPALHKVISKCNDFYVKASSYLRTSIDGLKASNLDILENNGFYPGSFAQGCESEFENEGVSSPLTSENHAMIQICLISDQILRSLLGLPNP